MNTENLSQTISEFKQSIEKLSKLHCDNIQEIKTEVENRLVSVKIDLEMQLKHHMLFSNNNKLICYSPNVCFAQYCLSKQIILLSKLGRE